VVSLLSNESGEKVLLYRSPEKITDCVWLNNDYIIISSATNIIISEIDYRGNVNTVTLPQTTTIAGKETDISKPQIFFNRQDGKLYILANDILLSSEKLVP